MSPKVLKPQVASLLMERFPQIGWALPNWEEKKCREISLPKISLQGIEALYFYGAKSSALYPFCRTWLKENRKRQLIILEKDLSTLAAFFAQELGEEILADPQVHIEWLQEEELQVEALCQRFAFEKIEVSGFGSEVASLRLEILRKTALHFALKLDRLHADFHWRNFLCNREQIPLSFYANGLKNCFSQTPAILCGAGPSLEKSLPFIKTYQDHALVIAGGSAIAALTSQGVCPHFGMAIDPNFEEYRRFKNSFGLEMPLIYSPRVHCQIFQTCNGPFGYLRSVAGGVVSWWMEEMLSLNDEVFGDSLSLEMMSVTGMALCYAHFLGCNPIFLTGVDLAYTNGKHYAPGVVEKEALVRENKIAADRMVKRKGRKGAWVHTAVRWVMEADSLADFAKQHPETQIFDATEGGWGVQKITYRSLQEGLLGFQPQDLRKKVMEAIFTHPMPKESGKIIEEKTQELSESLQRLIVHLEVLAGKKEGVKALAELELKEELAFSIFFYDIEKLLEKEDHFWERFLDMALRFSNAQSPILENH